MVLDTEIDWVAYMQEVAGFLSGEMDYRKLQGQTGPLVYPAVFLYIYSTLFWLTEGGERIDVAQWVFACLYLLLLAIVFKIYSATNMPSWTFAALCLSKRIHSIFVLRLFNDGVAMTLLYTAILLLIRRQWNAACVVFSVAVGVKMNVLLFAPGLWFILWTQFGFWGSLQSISICALVQIGAGLPFLTTYPMQYIQGAFDLGRQFDYTWTVNWRFVSQESFNDPLFSAGLLCAHCVLLVAFYCQWKRLIPSKDALTPRFMCYILFTSNIVGILCARSLHYQFYSWYMHSLPFLVVVSPIPDMAGGIMLVVVELCWNMYPSTRWSSMMLLACHICILAALLVRTSVHEVRIGLLKRD